jgi:hypothetical protein
MGATYGTAVGCHLCHPYLSLRMSTLTNHTTISVGSVRIGWYHDHDGSENYWYRPRVMTTTNFLSTPQSWYLTFYHLISYCYLKHFFVDIMSRSIIIPPSGHTVGNLEETPTIFTNRSRYNEHHAQTVDGVSESYCIYQNFLYQSPTLMHILLQENRLWVTSDVHECCGYLQIISSVCRGTHLTLGGCGRTALYMFLSHLTNHTLASDIWDAMEVLFSFVTNCPFRFPSQLRPGIVTGIANNGNGAPGVTETTTCMESQWSNRIVYFTDETQGTVGSYRHGHVAIQ